MQVIGTVRPWSTSISLTDDRRSKIALDDFGRDVRGKFGMGDHRRHGPRAIAFVGRHEFRTGHDRKRRDHRQAERPCVIVVDEEDDVRLLPLSPISWRSRSRENTSANRVQSVLPRSKAAPTAGMCEE